MDDKFYDAEEKVTAGCITFAWVLTVFAIAITLLMACNWLHSF